MLVWRKALALLTLMVFLPATVLAAMPVKLCLGADGHRAIESMIGGGHHVSTAHHNSDADSATENLNAPADCVDRSILTVASTAVRVSSDASKFSTVDKTPAVVLNAAVDLPSPPTLQILCASSAAKAADTDPFLVAHATDVLLN